jgi:O-antigen chain-terminating methyltransferase
LLKKRGNRRTPEKEAGGVESTAEITKRLRESSPNGHRIETFDERALMENLHLTNAYYDKNLPGEASSDPRRVLGPFYRFFKRIVWRLTSWYINPAIDNQRLFNAYATRSINEMKRYLDHLQINEDILSTIMRRDLALFRANMLFLVRYLENRMHDFENELELLRSGSTEWAATGPAIVAEGNDGEGETKDLLGALDILSLEQRVHGSPKVVKDRQRVYLPYFRGCRNVLAIGCGRGELLQLLAQEGISVRGVETNPTLVGYCRDHDLDVARVDPLEYLEAVDDCSLDGIALSRFAGHQPPVRLIGMLDLCRVKLADEGVLVIETPNPFSLYVAASYVLENSGRVHPLHPETLKLLCLSYGFVEPEVIFLNPLPPEEHLEELELTSFSATLDPREQELFGRVNENFQKMNRILFSHRDYALVTRLGRRDMG